MSSDIRLVLVSNAPAPYRQETLELVSSADGIDLSVVYCTRREPNRDWEVPTSEVWEVFLRDRVVKKADSFVYFNPEVWIRLRVLDPDVVVTTGFGPTFLVAALFAKSRQLPHIAMTDGTLMSEAALSIVHRQLRRLVFRHTDAYIGASRGSLHLYKTYGADADALFLSPLCVNNSRYRQFSDAIKRFDFIFSGRLVRQKNPDFALRVAKRASELLGRPTSLLLIGSGPMSEALRRQADGMHGDVEVTFGGFVEQEELPQTYASARLLLFPSSGDTWGVVANEAVAAGLPVIISPWAGAADELVVDRLNGYVEPLDLEAWARRSANLLSDQERYRVFSEASLDRISCFTAQRAAAGIVQAARWVHDR